MWSRNSIWIRWCHLVDCCSFKRILCTLTLHCRLCYRFIYSCGKSPLHCCLVRGCHEYSCFRAQCLFAACIHPFATLACEHVFNACRSFVSTVLVLLVRGCRLGLCRAGHYAGPLSKSVRRVELNPSDCVCGVCVLAPFGHATDPWFHPADVSVVHSSTR